MTFWNLSISPPQQVHTGRGLGPGEASTVLAMIYDRFSPPLERGFAVESSQGEKK